MAGRDQPSDGGGSFANPEMSDSIEQAYAKYRARIVKFDNGVTITEGELEDMTPEDRKVFIANMLQSSSEDIKESNPEDLA